MIHDELCSAPECWGRATYEGRAQRWHLLLTCRLCVPAAITTAHAGNISLSVFVADAETGAQQRQRTVTSSTTFFFFFFFFSPKFSSAMSSSATAARSASVRSCDPRQRDGAMGVRRQCTTRLYRIVRPC